MIKKCDHWIPNIRFHTCLNTKVSEAAQVIPLKSYTEI